MQHYNRFFKSRTIWRDWIEHLSSSVAHRFHICLIYKTRQSTNLNVSQYSEPIQDGQVVLQVHETTHCQWILQ